MPQASQRFCPQCGMPLIENQRFCSNCGATSDTSYSTPTAAAAAQENINPPPLVAPPPPPGSYGMPSQPSYSSQSAPAFPPAQQDQSTVIPPQNYVPPVKDSSGSVLRQIGCGVGLIILLVLVICGVTGYFGWQFVSSAVNQANATVTSSAGGTQPTTSNSDVTATTAPTVAKQINATITYAGVDITVLTAQQATSFDDDRSSGANGVLRLNVKENGGSKVGSFTYYDVARIVMPDKSVIAPTNFQKGQGPSASSTQTNWWDFPVPTNASIDQLILRVGTVTQAQMNIPLTGKADLSQYQPKTSQPNATTQYAQMQWTVTSVTRSFSGAGRQADQGMRYITLTIRVDNNSSTSFNRYWGEYMRLKSGDTTSTPTTDSDFPLSFDPGSTNKTGTVIFEMPEGSTSFTLILLGNTNTSPPTAQATINFQI